jgi:hypothetical protein
MLHFSFSVQNFMLYPRVEDVVGKIGRADPTGGGTGFWFRQQ